MNGNLILFFVIKVQDICLHLEKTFIYPKIFSGKFLGLSNRSNDSCKVTQGSNFEFDLIFSKNLLMHSSWHKYLENV